MTFILACSDQADSPKAPPEGWVPFEVNQYSGLVDPAWDVFNFNYDFSQELSDSKLGGKHTILTSILLDDPSQLENRTIIVISDQAYIDLTPCLSGVNHAFLAGYTENELQERLVQGYRTLGWDYKIVDNIHYNEYKIPIVRVSFPQPERGEVEYVMHEVSLINHSCLSSASLFTTSDESNHVEDFVAFLSFLKHDSNNP